MESILKTHLLTIFTSFLIISCTQKAEDPTIFYVKDISAENDGMINYLVENNLHNKIVIIMSSKHDFKHGQRFRFESIENN